ncbi:tetraacyldisaccharide 4'-kinase [Candidatus Tisiphia endosymbiont of Nemotelus uliginosus]|uniref:tetraacyldisaccharide 4'-kinase n=1 Tax=Candidatus Tisiphia endosymbiont of Nemotelus uliginosus TaxID=3077926 RepID=UPI0035C926E7
MIKLIYPRFWQTRNIIAYLLLPFTLIYLVATYIRKLITTPIRFPCKVICVGNISVGGTGKTQIVSFIAELLKAREIDFIIVTKGYGSNLKKALLVTPSHTALEVGDEAVMLLKYGKVIAAKKVQYLHSFVPKLKPVVMIIDDSFQNPNFYKDFVIMTIDAHRFFGNGFLLPAGPLRQNPKQAIVKSDIIISVSATNVHPDYCTSNIKDKLFYAQIIPSIDIDKTKNFFAFSGIGNPDRFFSTLENYGLRLLGYKIFPDHYQYSQEDLEYLAKQAEQYNAYLITTKKDYVKIDSTKLPIICCDVHLSINNDRQLRELIYEKIL